MDRLEGGNGGAGREDLRLERHHPRFVGNKLGEAVVVRYNKYKGLTGGRYTYNGGEAFGQRHAITQYNVLMEAEREKDDGGATGYFYEFLPKIDPKVRYGTDYPSAEAANTSVGITRDVSQDIGSLNGIEESLPITLFYKTVNLRYSSTTTTT